MTSYNTCAIPDGSITRDARTIGLARRGTPGGPAVLWCHGGPGSRLAIMTLPPEAAFVERFMATVPASFTFGVVGYADDRIADGRGWGSFDPGAVRCPVLVLHGGSDSGVPVENAYLTARLIPGADLRIFPDHGHFSIPAEVLPALTELTA